MNQGLGEAKTERLSGEPTCERFGLKRTNYQIEY